MSAYTWYPFPTCNYTTNPNNHSPAPNKGYQNYSPYECRETPPSNMNFWIMGQPRPTCRIGSCPAVDFWATHGLRADNNEFSSLQPEFPGYDRNARYVDIKRGVWGVRNKLC